MCDYSRSRSKGVLQSLRLNRLENSAASKVAEFSSLRHSELANGIAIREQMCR